MFDLEKYDDFDECLVWFINDEEVSYDEVLEISDDNKDVEISAGLEDYWFEVYMGLTFDVSMQIGIKYEKILDESGWLITGSLSARCNEYNNFEQDDSFEKKFSKYARKTIIDAEDTSTEEECSYPDMTLYPTFKEAFNNLNLPIDYFFKRLLARGEILGKIFEVI